MREDASDFISNEGGLQEVYAELMIAQKSDFCHLFGQYFLFSSRVARADG
jgi:hypothetical protein